MKVGVLGGGLSGLVVAGHTRHHCEVLEANDRTGGHCRSLVEDGYTFDIGGPHILFSRNKEVLGYILEQLAGNVAERKRNNKVFLDGKFIKYPFENGLSDLEPEDRFECLYHYLNNDHPKPANFKQWIYHTFGTAIAEMYMIPYNEKIWNTPAEQMAFDWVEGRVPKPPMADVIKSAVGMETEGYTHQLYFNYPIEGGIEALIKAFGKKCRSITTNFRVSRVRRRDGRWLISDGTDEKVFDKLISTIPIQDLIEALADVPEEIARRTAALKFNSLVTVMLGARSDSPPPYLALYVPEKDYPFHRLSFPLNFTPNGAPAGCMAVMAEITTNVGDGVYELSDGEITEKVIGGIERMGLIEPKAIDFKRVSRARYAYVVRTFDYKENLEKVLAYLDGLGITSLGRNAQFEYINMDEAVRRAMVAAEELA